MVTLDVKKDDWFFRSKHNGVLIQNRMCENAPMFRMIGYYLGPWVIGYKEKGPHMTWDKLGEPTRDRLRQTYNVVIEGETPAENSL